MDSCTFLLPATRAYIAVQLERALKALNFMACGIALVLALFGLLRNGIDPVVFGCIGAALIFWMHILQMFVRWLGRDGAEPSANLADLLATAVVRTLPDGSGMDTAMLIRAATIAPRGVFILTAMELTNQKLLECIEKNRTQLPDLCTFLASARDLMTSTKAVAIDAPHVLTLAFRQLAFLKPLLDGCDLSAQDFDSIVLWEATSHTQAGRPHFWSPRGLVRMMGTVGRSWVSGYTKVLDQLTDDIGDKVSFRDPSFPVVHKDSIETILRVFARSAQRNVVILGKGGVGKRTLVANVTIALHEQERLHALPTTRVLRLHSQQLLSGTQQRDAVLLRALEKADEAGHLILVIEDAPLLLKSADPALKGVLIKFLQARNITIVCIADTQDYHTLIKTDPSIDALLEKIYLDDPSEQETRDVLLYACATLKNVRVTYRAIRAIQQLCKRYIPQAGEPGRSIAILNDAVALCKTRREGIVRETDVREAVSLKARVNVQQITTSDREKLLLLEDRLHQRIIGQENALRALVNALKRARLDIHSGKRPLGTFLFLGPTGVGKTQTAKVLAEEYFGSGDAFIRVDLNEYSTAESVGAIVGRAEASGGYAEGFLTKRVQDHPFSLVLLDEIEKAHPHVLNLFLQILDEGALIDGRGVKNRFP